MTQELEAVNEERARHFKRVVIDAIDAQGPTDADEVLNGLIQAVCILIEGCPDDTKRAQMAAESVCLILTDAGCDPDQVLDVMDEMADIHAPPMGQA